MTAAPRGLPVYAARIAVLAFCICYAIGNLYISAVAWDIPDIGAYWAAAMRLREGAALYPAVPDVNASDVYRYAPWFAFAWVPLTHLPRALVDTAWSAALLLACTFVVVPSLKTRSRAAIAFAAIVGSFLVLVSSRGNVQPLMIVALVFGVERRTGPIWIALCASLKATPLLYAVVYAMRGEWHRFWMTVGLTGALVVPMVFFGLDGYTTDPGRSQSLFAISPALFLAVALASVVVAVYVAWRHRPWAWLAASVAVILCLPRYFPYELSFLFVGMVPVVEGWRARAGDAGAVQLGAVRAP